MSDQLYRVHWRAVRYRETGHWPDVYPRAQAQNIAAAQNENNAPYRRYWIEPVKLDPEAEAQPE